MTAEQSIRNIEHLMDAVNAATQVKPDPRADLVDLFEAHAETHYDKSWIEVEEAVDLVIDNDWQQTSWSTLTKIDAIVADMELQPEADAHHVQKQVARLRAVLNSALHGANS